MIYSKIIYGIRLISMGFFFGALAERLGEGSILIILISALVMGVSTILSLINKEGKEPGRS